MLAGRVTTAAAPSAPRAGEQETWRLLRGNAITGYRPDRYGITS
jgi:hypothetical protein